MPDQYGFNQLGQEVRCIDCEQGGPRWQWTERKRQRHARQHRPIRTTQARRPRNLLAAPPTKPHEEKEATTMAKKQGNKGESAKQVAIDLLREAGEPLTAREIAKRVIASGRCTGLKGKTPEATISAMLAVGSKPGGPFARVAKGTYTLATPQASEDEPTPVTAEKSKQPRKRSAKTSP